MTNLIFLPDQAIVVEFGDGGGGAFHHHFANWSKWTSKIYLDWGNFGRPSSIYINPEEFRKTMEGVVRISRFFYFQHRDCGFDCWF